MSYFRLVCPQKVVIWRTDGYGSEHEYRTVIWDAGTCLSGTILGNGSLFVFLDDDGDGNVYIPNGRYVPIDQSEVNWNCLKGK